MKRLILIISSLFLVTVLVFLLFLNKTEDLQIVKDKSYFSDFYVEGEKVYIKCEITIKNPSLHQKTFKLNAILEDDVELGLLKDENLVGYNQELTSDKFTIEKKSASTISVVFVGEFAGTYKKHDRNLPAIVINEVD